MESNPYRTRWNLCILFLYLIRSLSTFAKFSIHCPLVWPINPHLIQSLCTLSYLHCIQVLEPSSSHNMKPENTGIQGSIRTLAPKNLMFLGKRSSQSTFSKPPHYLTQSFCHLKVLVLKWKTMELNPNRYKIEVQLIKYQIRSPFLQNQKCAINSPRTFLTHMIKVFHMFKMQEVKERISSHNLHGASDTPCKVDYSL